MKKFSLITGLAALATVGAAFSTFIVGEATLGGEIKDSFISFGIYTNIEGIKIDGLTLGFKENYSNAEPVKVSVSEKSDAENVAVFTTTHESPMTLKISLDDENGFWNDYFYAGGHADPFTELAEEAVGRLGIKYSWEFTDAIDSYSGKTAPQMFDFFVDHAESVHELDWGNLMNQGYDEIDVKCFDTTKSEVEVTVDNFADFASLTTYNTNPNLGVEVNASWVEWDASAGTNGAWVDVALD